VDVLLLLSTFGLGLRHGVDWDHLSAIADITGAEYRRARAAFMAVLYALGHGAAVMALGALAIVAGERLPSWIDPVMQRVVGVTLLLLAVLLVRSLRSGGGATVSRGMLLFRGLTALRARLRRTKRVEVAHEHDHAGEHGHDHDVSGTDDTSHRVLTSHRHQHVHAVDVTSYTAGGALAVGVLHGVGAETGTQAVVLVSASRVASTPAALAILGAFVLGIIVTTGGLAVGAAFGWKAVSRGSRAFVLLTAVTAVASATVGLLFVTGHAGALPGLA
jgi:high-affinity nickel-transport protein